MARSGAGWMWPALGIGGTGLAAGGLGAYLSQDDEVPEMMIPAGAAQPDTALSPLGPPPSAAQLPEVAAPPRSFWETPSSIDALAELGGGAAVPPVLPGNLEALRRPSRQPGAPPPPMASILPGPVETLGPSGLPPAPGTLSPAEAQRRWDATREPAERAVAERDAADRQRRNVLLEGLLAGPDAYAPYQAAARGDILPGELEGILDQRIGRQAAADLAPIEERLRRFREHGAVTTMAPVGGVQREPAHPFRTTAEMEAAHGPGEWIAGKWVPDRETPAMTPEDEARAAAIRESILARRGGERLRSPSEPPDFGGDPMRYAKARAEREVELARRRANVERLAQQRGAARGMRIGRGIPVPAGEQGGLGYMLSMLGHPAGPDILRSEMEGRTAREQTAMQREALGQQGRTEADRIAIEREKNRLMAEGYSREDAHRMALLNIESEKLNIERQKEAREAEHQEWLRKTPEGRALTVAMAAPGTAAAERAADKLVPETQPSVLTGEKAVEEIVRIGNDAQAWEREQVVRGVAREEIEREGRKRFGEWAWRDRKIPPALRLLLGIGTHPVEKPIEEWDASDYLRLAYFPTRWGKPLAQSLRP